MGVSGGARGGSMGVNLGRRSAGLHTMPYFHLLAFTLLSAVALAQPALQRPQFMLQGLQFGHGVPGAPLQILAQLAGLPLGLRADLQGRCVVRDGAAPRLWLWDATGLNAVALATAATDAVPDGAGGAWALAPDAVGGGVWHVGPDGASTQRVAFTETPLRLALVGTQHALLLVRDSTAQFLMVVHDLRSGTRRAQRLLPAAPNDLHFDDEGRVLLAGQASGRVLHLNALTLRTEHYTEVPQGTVECAALAGRGLVGVVQPGFVLWSASPLHAVQMIPLGWSVRFEALTSGGVVAWVPATGEAYRFEPNVGLAWQGPAAAGLFISDGSGLRHGRGAALHSDSDGDGFSSAAELAELTDPGDAISVPLQLVQAGPLLIISAPRHPCALWWLQVCGAVAPPLNLLDPPAWMSGVFGSSDPTGQGYCLLFAPLPTGAALAPVLLDLSTNQVLSAPAMAMLSW